MKSSAFPGLFLFCRSGYESDCAAEIQFLANKFGCQGYCKTKPDSGHVLFCTADQTTAQKLYEKIDFSQLIFARQWFVLYAWLKDLPQQDRISPVIDCLREIISEFGLTIKQTVIQQSSPEAKDNIQRFVSSLTPLLLKAIKKHLSPAPAEHSHDRSLLQLCFVDTQQLFLGYLPQGVDWAGGIPRLKIPASAPSRSYLKLEEALIRFIPEKQREHCLAPGMSATDLGAAPGGWSWLLIQNHLKVMAVDNGPLKTHLLDSGLCTHIRQDAFSYEPGQRCDWLVCDIVDKPLRVLALIRRWLSNRWCHRVIFNLKLPMQQRFRFIQKELFPWLQELQRDNLITNWQAKHLYHDRHEITLLL